MIVSQSLLAKAKQQLDDLKQTMNKLHRVACKSNATDDEYRMSKCFTMGMLRGFASYLQWCETGKSIDGADEIHEKVE